MVFKTAMDWAIGHKAKRLFVLSNRKLIPALHLYKKYGFKEIVLDNFVLASMKTI